MDQFRLIGLVLFITTAFLAMASAVTQTTHIRFKRPSSQVNDNLDGADLRPDTQQNTLQPSPHPSMVLPPGLNPSLAAGSGAADETASARLQFISVPVIYPLLIAGTLGLMMWFGPASLSRATPSKRRRRR